MTAARLQATAERFMNHVRAKPGTITLSLDGIIQWTIYAGDCLAEFLGSSRTFRGTSDQIAAVRCFVRSAFGNHLACDDAVLVASELAANAVAHTASGDEGGTFTVHLATVSAERVAMFVTDQGGPTVAKARHADVDAESGRGLDIVTAIASLFVVAGNADWCGVLAVIPAITSIGANLAIDIWPTNSDMTRRLVTARSSGPCSPGDCLR
jgi:serine/threonine-protein kinase RsbW